MLFLHITFLWRCVFLHLCGCVIHDSPTNHIPMSHKGYIYKPRVHLCIYMREKEGQRGASDTAAEVSDLVPFTGER